MSDHGKIMKGTVFGINGDEIDWNMEDCASGDEILHCEEPAGKRRKRINLYIS